MIGSGFTTSLPAYELAIRQKRPSASLYLISETNRETCNIQRALGIIQNRQLRVVDSPHCSRVSSRRLFISKDAELPAHVTSGIQAILRRLPYDLVHFRSIIQLNYLFLYLTVFG